jgi:hypothetical protein
MNMLGQREPDGEAAIWRRISAWLHRVSTGWVTLVAVVVLLLFMVFVLPAQSANSAGAEGAGSPDTSLFYTPRDLYRMADAYGPQGRADYIRARFTFDLVFPIVYTFFLVTTIGWLTRRAFASDSRWQLANLIPLVGALFDYLENVATSVVMARYPEMTTAVAVLASVFTPIKWLFVVGSFVLLLIVAVAAILPGRGARQAN